MKSVMRIALLIALFVGITQAQFLAPVPSLEKDTKGQNKKFEYTIPLTGISDPGILLQHFSQRMVLVYYFSPKCPHCQHTFPKYQAMVKEFEGKGLTGIAISVGDAKKNDIRAFMDQQNSQVAMFQDTNGKFSAAYGTGHVPLAILVFPDGTFIRYTENGAETYAQIRDQIVKKFAKK